MILAVYLDIKKENFGYKQSLWKKPQERARRPSCRCKQKLKIKRSTSL